MEIERPEKGTARFSVRPTCNKLSFYDSSAFIWFSFLCPKKIPCHLATVNAAERGQSTASMAAFFNNNERFHNKYSNA